ncbi:MAG: 4-alpha-glucanotransferase [Phycisphaerae bacterium]|nr:4-alpha-glucanotransferase [Phycisphaerae bacterium]
MRRLAGLRGVMTSYTDASGVKRSASAETLARVLTALGSPAGTEAQASASEVRLVEALSRRRVEPVTVAWAGTSASAALSIGGTDRGRVTWGLRLESGETRDGAFELSSLKSGAGHSAPGGGARRVMVPLPPGLPTGYHRLSLGHAGERFDSMLIVAPRRSYREPRAAAARAWGLFCPAYSLRSGRSWGVGDLSDVRELARWSGALGGRVVATLPLLACFLGEARGPCDPSPYAPISRVFWNELFVDPTRTAEFAGCEAAKRIASSSAFSREASRLRRGALVDYREAARLKRRVMEALARSFFDQGGERSESFRMFLGEKPSAREYAVFRGVTERRGEPWTDWPVAMRRRLVEGDADASAVRYHLYAQYAAWMELLATGAELKAAGGAMYLDLPVGASGVGFDAWKHGDLFAPCAAGAPPDPFFTSGQNWGFPPMHPWVCREDGYAYLRECLRSHMRHAEFLRLDHVMAFHRLFWVPEGMSPRDGAYVRYRDEEMYAVLCLESHRSRCRLIGENLGTVPPEVGRSLARHGLSGLYVAQYEMKEKSPALRRVPRECVASVNTHDMPPFASMWSGRDVGDRIALGMLDGARRKRELESRKRAKAALVARLRREGLLASGAAIAPVSRVRDALLRHLASSDAELVLINIEDLWLETEWQNVPGTTGEHPNWRRKLRLTLESIKSDAGLARLLGRIDAVRRESKSRGRRSRGARR